MKSEEYQSSPGENHPVGRFPRPGDVLALDAWELRVEEITGRGTARIKLTRRSESDETAFIEKDSLSGPTDSYPRELQRAGQRQSHLEHAA